MCSLTNEFYKAEDSAESGRPILRTPSPDTDTPRVTPDIVSSRTAPESSPEDSGAVWFLMRVAYGREDKARTFLEDKGIITFLPKITRIRLRNGKRKRVEESLIPNLLFVRSDEKTLRQFIGQPPTEYLHHYYIPNLDNDGNPIGLKGIRPLIIPDSQMDQFIKWNEVHDDNKLFLSENSIKIKEGDYVKITDGKFAGISGFVCRLKKQTRVGVHIAGLGTVFTAYIPSAFLQPATDI